MSKRNRENRARKKKAEAQKRKPSRDVPPPEFMALASNPEARRRFAIMIPFMVLGNQNPYTPGMEVPDGSFIIGTAGNKQGYIPGHQVRQLIAETQQELSVSYDEVISMIVDAVNNGLIQITGEPPPEVEHP